MKIQFASFIGKNKDFVSSKANLTSFGVNKSIPSFEGKSYGYSMSYGKKDGTSGEMCAHVAGVDSDISSWTHYPSAFQVYSTVRSALCKLPDFPKKYTVEEIPNDRGYEYASHGYVYVTDPGEKVPDEEKRKYNFIVHSWD